MTGNWDLDYLSPPTSFPHGGAKAGGDGGAECERSKSAHCCSPFFCPSPPVPVRSPTACCRCGCSLLLAVIV